MKLIPYGVYVQLSYNRSSDIFLCYIIQNQNIYPFPCVFPYDQFYQMNYRNDHLLKDTQVDYL